MMHIRTVIKPNCIHHINTGNDRRWKNVDTETYADNEARKRVYLKRAVSSMVFSKTVFYHQR